MWLKALFLFAIKSLISSFFQHSYYPRKLKLLHIVKRAFKAIFTMLQS